MAAALGQLAYDRNLLVMPRESEGGYDPRSETRSGGPWVLENYQRSVAFTFRRNPNWWNADKVFLDGIDMPIIAETAVVTAQFRAKKIWGFGPPAQDVIGLKKDLPDLVIDQNAFNKACYQLDFGMQPGSPFRDSRVRQAVSMLIDRDAYIDTWNNVTNFKKEGYPVEVRYHANISSGWDGYWVDPKGKDMGEGAKSFTLNVAEAKKLLSAAGFNGPIETEMAWIATGQYGTDFPKWAETFKGMLEADGLFKFKQVNPDYQTEYLPKYYWNKADFKGIAVAATTIYPADPDGHMYSYYHSQGSRQKVAFQGKETIDAKSDKLIEDQRKELDAKKRVEIIKEWQRYTATQMPIIPFPGQASTFTLYWPWAGNAGVFRDWDGESARFQHPLHLWYDKSKYSG
jgi:ABC-type transport system substrate-binding protein